MTNAVSVADKAVNWFKPDSQICLNKASYFSFFILVCMYYKVERTKVIVGIKKERQGQRPQQKIILNYFFGSSIKLNFTY